MHPCIVLALLTACGRVGFDPVAEVDAPVTPDAPPAEGLVVHFTFPDDIVEPHGSRDEISGVVAPCDITGDYSCPLGTDDGPGLRRAAHFDGVVDCLPLPYAPRLDLGNVLTVASWVRIDALPAPSQIFSIVRRPFGTMFDDSYGLEVRDDGHIESTTSPLIQTTGSSLLAVGVWTHVASTWDGARVRLYIDGAQDQMRDVTSTSYDMHDLVIGCDIEAEVPDSFLPGAVADVRIYNRALSPSEIATLAQ